MQSSVWEQISKEYQEYPEDFAESVMINEIEEAEKKINLSFSDTYKKFIHLYGAGLFDGHFIHGLRYIDMMDKYRWSVIDKTTFYKNDQKWPDIDDWYIISDDGRGNPIGCKPDGSVWLSDHDAAFERVKLADNFEEFLHKLLTDTLYE